MYKVYFFIFLAALSVASVSAWTDNALYLSSRSSTLNNSFESGVDGWSLSSFSTNTATRTYVGGFAKDGEYAIDMNTYSCGLSTYDNNLYIEKNMTDTGVLSFWYYSLSNIYASRLRVYKNGLVYYNVSVGVSTDGWKNLNLTVKPGDRVRINLYRDVSCGTGADSGARIDFIQVLSGASNRVTSYTPFFNHSVTDYLLESMKTINFTTNTYTDGVCTSGDLYYERVLPSGSYFRGCSGTQVSSIVNENICLANPLRTVANVIPGANDLSCVQDSSGKRIYLQTVGGYFRHGFIDMPTRYLNLPASVTVVTNLTMNFTVRNITSAYTNRTLIDTTEGTIYYSTSNLSGQTVYSSLNTSAINSYIQRYCAPNQVCSIPIYFQTNNPGEIIINSVHISNEGVNENAASYDQNVFETSRQNFTLNMSYETNIYSAASAYLYYDGVMYSGSNTQAGPNTLVRVSLDVPTISESAENKTLFWMVKLTNSTSSYYFNLTRYNQTVMALPLYHCNTTYNISMINFTTRSLPSPFATKLSMFKSTWNYYLGAGTVKKSYSYEDITYSKSNFAFCSNIHTQFFTDASIEYKADGYSKNYYYITGATLSNLTQNITLYLLNESEATVTVLQARDGIQRGVPGVVVAIQQYDLGTDSYYTVAMARTSADGKDISYLNWFNTFYRFTLSLNDTTLQSTGPEKIIESPKIFNLFGTEIYEFDKFRDFDYSLTFNNVTNNFILTFTKPSGLVDTGCLRITKRTPAGDQELSLQCSSSNSATLFYNIENDGNGTFIASFYATGSYDFVGMITASIGGKFSDSVRGLLGDRDSLFYAVLMSGVVLSMFLITPVLGIIGMLLGIAASAALGFQTVEYLTFCGIAIVGGALIWVLKR